MDDKVLIQRIKQLVEKLNAASDAYYLYDNPIMSDHVYDEMMDKLEFFEKQTGYVLSNSPLHKVQGKLLDGFKKVKHTKPMLSANKTKDIDEIGKFIGGHKVVESFKLDGCFSPNTRIRMADGTEKKIKDIKVGDMVLSFNENTNIVSANKVLNVFDNGKKEFDEWIRIRLFNDYKKTPYCLKCTKNHKVYTEGGWKEAGNISIGDKVYFYNYVLSDEQKSILLGIGLGDGWFVDRRNSDNLEPKLEWHYSKVNKNEYPIMIDHINNMFNFNSPKITTRTSGYGSEMLDINLHTMIVPEYMVDKNNMLRCGFTYTEDILDNITPLSLAILYIDDGSKSSCREDGYTKTFNKKVRCELATNRHDYENVILFSEYLNNAGYTNSVIFEKPVISGQGGGYKICFNTDGTERFFDDIAKYIPKQLRKIKLGTKDKWQNCEEYRWWENTGDYGLHEGGIVSWIKNGFKNKEPNLIRKNRKSYMQAYDLEVENNHTYFANNYAVHNCSIVSRYEKGVFKQAITRGNGEIGEDVTENFRNCTNLPLKLRYDFDLEVRGECVISWENFNKINESLKEPYSHPRNLAAGSLRCIDTNVSKDRHLEYIAFELVDASGSGINNDNIAKADLIDTYEFLKTMGFDVVPHHMVDVNNYEDIDADLFNPEEYEYPVDGTIFKYNSYEYGKSLGMTAHHPLDMIARKWKDEEVETTLKEVQWQLGKTGQVTPVAVFEPVEIDGSIVEKATLHNLSIFESYKLAVGDTITAYKANQIIPQIAQNLSAIGREDESVEYIKPPTTCPVCGMPVEVKQDNNTKFLVCGNEGCDGKLVAQLTHFASKNAMDIDGLSESTIEKLVNAGILSSIMDIYDLYIRQNDMTKIDGLGEKLVDKLLKSIDDSKVTTLDRYIYSLSIPLIGRTASKAISNYFNGDFDAFYDCCDRSDFNFEKLDGFGSQMAESIQKYIDSNYDMMFHYLPQILNIDKPDVMTIDNSNISGKTFVITGKLNTFSNRDELKDKIESMGGNVVGSVSAKTDFLVNNDIESNSSKNKKAKDLGIPIIDEQKLIEMMS